MKAIDPNPEHARRRKQLRTSERGVSHYVALGIVALIAVVFIAGWFVGVATNLSTGSTPAGYTVKTFPTTISLSGATSCGWVNSSKWSDQFCLAITPFSGGAPGVYTLTGTYSHQNTTSPQSIGPLYQFKGGTYPAVVWVSPGGHGYLSWDGANIQYPTIGAGN